MAHGSRETLCSLIGLLYVQLQHVMMDERNGGKTSLDVHQSSRGDK